jgi:hypothetical protein
MRRGLLSLIVLSLMLLAPLANLDLDLEAEDIVSNSSHPEEVADVHDVPTWRIGDEWVYDSKFDVDELIAQAEDVEASVDTLGGDTTMEVTDIYFEDINGTQTLLYELTIEGDFTSGNNGAELDGYTGRVDVAYEGIDVIRARDLATYTNTFSLDVDFLPYNLGFLKQDLADITFANTYTPPREKYDFLLRTGDQWVSHYWTSTDVSGTSDYFDTSQFDSQSTTNSTYQVTDDGTPTENGTYLEYTGCSDSHKVKNWNATGTSTGFEWYCEDIRSFAWYRYINPAGFQIDWLLKTYNPTDSSGNVAGSSPGIRNSIIEVTPEFLAILPNATEEVLGHYYVGQSDQVSTNLQLRYEIDGTIMSLTTDHNGNVMPDLDVGYSQDYSPSSDDWTSNGVIVWDPVQNVVGAATIVMDLSVVGVDLVAKADSMIVTRHRGNDSITLSQATGYNALPGDTLHFSVPAQNRGVLTSPATEMEIVTPDGTTIRGNLPALSPYTEARVDVNWTVSVDAPIGTQTLTFMVDPDEVVTADANRSNNNASLEIFIGRMPDASMIIDDGLYTFENISFDASASTDLDGGEVECFFEIEDGSRTQYINAPDCLANWSWVDDGMWNVTVRVVDDELDEVSLTMQAEVLNRDPYVNLSAVAIVVDAGGALTFDASDSGDIDTISPEGQHVVITWPESACDEGLYGPYCTIRPEVEGMHTITVVVTDDDDASVSDSIEFEVLNVDPTIGEIAFSIGGIPYLAAEDGTWSIDEGIFATWYVEGDDTLSDREELTVTWTPSDMDSNHTETTFGPESSIEYAWDEPGIHMILAYVTDNDGVTSSTVQGFVRVNNIAPIMNGLPTQQALFEDEILILNASAIDFADQDKLKFCWDLLSYVDSDEDGDMTNDCDVEDANLVMTWSTPGLRIITANVWDDNDAHDSKTVQVTIVNRPPIAKISEPEEGFTITQGESITFSASESIDTETDRSTLIFRWDDPNTKGSFEDGFGENITINFPSSGSFIVNLTVFDDDGVDSTASVVVTVNEKPTEGLFGFSTTTSITAALGLVIITLIAVLLLRGRNPDMVIHETKELPTMVDSWPEAAPVIAPQPAPDNLSGPPPPVGGLPEGWTMEQWSYYGEQYLASQTATTIAQPAYVEPTPVSQPVYQEPVQTTSITPMVQEPAPTPASQALADLLGDLDL